VAADLQSAPWLPLGDGQSAKKSRKCQTLRHVRPGFSRSGRDREKPRGATTRRGNWLIAELSKSGAAQRAGKAPESAVNTYEQSETAEAAAADRDGAG
jgi:hypothetical protein